MNTMLKILTLLRKTFLNGVNRKYRLRIYLNGFLSIPGEIIFFFLAKAEEMKTESGVMVKNINFGWKILIKERW